MSVLNSIVIALSCFTAIPMPFVEWDQRNMRYMMVAFPLAGVLVGAASWLWYMASSLMGLSAFAHALGLTLVPLVVTGGIHMDGFADVVDALCSHASPEQKRQILKDPHVGAFAVTRICCYLLVYCACAYELDANSVLLLCAIPVMSRCLSSLAAIMAHPFSNEGMLAAVNEATAKGPVSFALRIMVVIVSGFVVWLNPLTGMACIAAAIISLAWVLKLAEREFGGMSGDLLGFYVQVSELAMLACVALVGKVA